MSGKSIVRLKLENVVFSNLYIRFLGNNVFPTNYPKFTVYLGKRALDPITLEALTYLSGGHELVAIFIPSPERMVFSVWLGTMRFLVRFWDSDNQNTVTIDVKETDVDFSKTRLNSCQASVNHRLTHNLSISYIVESYRMALPIFFTGLTGLPRS